MRSLWLEFFAVALAHLLAVASPGPDFAVVVRQSLRFGRRVGCWTAVGIGTGILVHVTYSVLGFGLLLRGSALWFNAFKYAGAAYLAWLGVQSLRSRARSEGTFGTGPDQPPSPRRGSAFATGFFTNAFNPKATHFFISLYLLVVSPRTPKLVQAGYGVWMSLATMAWFCFVATGFTHASLRATFLRHGHWIDRILGVVLLGFALALVLATA